MPMFSYEQLQAKSNSELIALYNQQAQRTEVSMGFLRDELFRRDLDKQQNQVWWMTLAVAMLTVVYTAVSCLQLYKMFHS